MPRINYDPCDPDKGRIYFNKEEQERIRIFREIRDYVECSKSLKWTRWLADGKVTNLGVYDITHTYFLISHILYKTNWKL